jgi:hypothetical protein
MKTVFSFLILAMALNYSQFLNAMDISLMARPKPLPQPTPTPVPPPPKKTVPKFANLMKVWKTGIVPTEDNLTGTWKVFGMIPGSQCQTIAPELWVSEEKRHPDPAFPWSSLLFQRVQSPVDNKFYFTVAAKHYMDEQGPYRLESAEPQFSFWISGTSGPDKSAWFEFSCHLNAQNKEQLYCAVHLRLDNPKSGGDVDGIDEPTVWDDNAINCAKHNVGLFIMFFKTPNL